uniref:Cornifelin homolog B-like n=2 Tax=Cyprinus carpio TaxID=7962 RepID=A0A8C1N6J1_CYPCA
MFVTVAFQSISQSDYCGRLINQWLSGTSAGCFSVWCFPCFACITARDHGECLCLPLLDSCGCIPPITLSMRVSTRRRYGITDSICNDCVYSYFCGPCSWCQIRREMKARLHPVTLFNNRPT